MRKTFNMRLFVVAMAIFASACSTMVNSLSVHPSHVARKALLVKAAALIDDFYSFDPKRLRIAMADATSSVGDIVYYQGWAEAGNYVPLERKPCRFQKVDEIICGVTVKDDLAAALHISYHVTDYFHVAFRGDRIVKVWNSSDDPPEFNQAMAWLHTNQPEIFAGPCRGIWEDGPTPQLCVRAIAKGFAEFTAPR